MNKDNNLKNSYYNIRKSKQTNLNNIYNLIILII